MFDIFEDLEVGERVEFNGEMWLILKSYPLRMRGYALAVREKDLLPATPKLIKLKNNENLNGNDKGEEKSV